jgi:hypothetical protein
VDVGVRWEGIGEEVKKVGAMEGVETAWELPTEEGPGWCGLVRVTELESEV